MKFSGKVSLGILAGKDPAIGDPVEGNIEEPGDHGNPWKGSLVLFHGDALVVKQMYQLALDDGRSGYLFVTSVQRQPNGTSLVEFQGGGPLQ